MLCCVWFLCVLLFTSFIFGVCVCVFLLFCFRSTFFTVSYMLLLPFDCMVLCSYCCRCCCLHRCVRFTLIIKFQLVHAPDFHYDIHSILQNQSHFSLVSGVGICVYVRLCASESLGHARVPYTE